MSRARKLLRVGERVTSLRTGKYTDLSGMTGTIESVKKVKGRPELNLYEVKMDDGGSFYTDGTWPHSINQLEILK